MKRILSFNAKKNIIILVTIWLYILWIIIYALLDNKTSVSETVIFITSWIGVINFIAYVFFWKSVTGSFFSLINVFLGFFALFNFGQCFLWAVGIHSNYEIGKGLVFSSLRASSLSIFKAQIIFIICFNTLNMGVVLFWKKRMFEISPLEERRNQDEIKYKSVYYTSLIMSVFTIPVTFYDRIIRLIYSQLYSYHDLYYGEISSMLGNLVISIGSSGFFICLLGLLIGSKYKPRVRKVVYTIYLFFSFIALLSGDRGEWIMGAIILLWADFNFNKKVKTRTLIKWSILVIIIIFLSNAIVKMRNTGLSFKGFISNLTSPDENFIVSLIMEFGQTMGICIIVVQEHVVCPYGNTYLMTIPTILGTGLANRVFGMNYVQLHTWFPRDFLGINYGTDFSVIGEAILNFGVYLSPIVLFLEGVILSKMHIALYKKKDTPLKILLSLVAFESILGIPRSTMWLTLNSYAQSVLVFCFVYFSVKIFFKRSLHYAVSSY